jgi:CheY-like chemotaxis protein
MVKKCTDMMKNRGMEKGLSVFTTVDSELDDPNVWHLGDPTRLNQVLLNFLSNAVKFTHRGSVECKLSMLKKDQLSTVSCSRSSNCADSFIEIGGEAGEAGGGARRSSCSSSGTADLLRIEVIDTGIGLDDCSKLFTAFTQASASVHQKYGGTGLGLSIAKKIVQMMHGEVGMSSSIGVGTTVWAEIPLRRAPVPRKGPASFGVSESLSHHKLHQHILTSSSSGVGADRAKRCSRSSSGESARSVRILIAEDNKVNQKVLKRLLETLGYTDISVAWNGQEAVEAVKASWRGFLEAPGLSGKGRYDIVLMVSE